MINYYFQNIWFRFKVNKEVFSPKGIDQGTEALLNTVIFRPEDKVLDLGCGYGIVGIIASKFVGEANVYMSDISETATLLTEENARLNGMIKPKVILSNGFSNIETSEFTLILSNPPYHEDFKVPKAFIEKGYHHLKLGGKMYMVTKRKLWYKNKFIRVFGGVKIYEKYGYYIFEGEKKGKALKIIKHKNQMSKKLQRKQRRQFKDKDSSKD